MEKYTLTIDGIEYDMYDSYDEARAHVEELAEAYGIDNEDIDCYFDIY